MKDRYTDIHEYIHDLQEAIEKDPKCAIHHYNLGVAMLSLGDYTEAEECFLNAVRNSAHKAEDFVQRERFEAFSCTSEVYPDVVFPLDFISVNQKANLNQLYTMRLQVRGEAGQPVPSPGLSTMVTIRLQPTQAHLVSIPATALFEHDGQVAVWLYEPASQQVKRCPVKPREILNNGTVIVSEGLKAGDLVVTAGVHVLHDGERVEPLPEVSPTNVGGML